MDRSAIWQNAATMTKESFTCGHCGAFVGSNFGYYSTGGSGRIYICSACNCPNFFHERGKQVPRPGYGTPIEHLPEELEKLYDEIRGCISIGSFTMAVLGARKLLMNVAVNLGAKEGQNFEAYVGWLVSEGHVPNSSKGWVKHIKDKGNEANHEIRLMPQEEAVQITRFAEMLLRITYEYPKSVPGSTPETP